MGLGEKGGLQLFTVCKQLNTLIVGVADFPGALEGEDWAPGLLDGLH